MIAERDFELHSDFDPSIFDKSLLKSALPESFSTVLKDLRLVLSKEFWGRTIWPHLGKTKER
jgi:hypothetical protein